MIWNKLKSPPLLAAIGLLMFSQIAAILLRNGSEDLGIKLMAPLDSVSQMQSVHDVNYHTISADETTKINRLNKIISSHKEQHKLTFLELYKFHFASLSLLTIFSILTGILAFVIGHNGWKETSGMVKTLFLTSVALTSFYGLSINVYQQDVGINKNLNSYIQYDNIQKEILNYCSTSPNQALNGDTLAFSDFHTLIVEKLVNANTIYLEFDQDAIEMKDYLK